MPAVPLVPHPSTPCPYVRELIVRVESRGGAQLAFQYLLNGAIEELDLPPQRFAVQADGLWKQTCFEAFARVPGARSYVELNFSPSSEWAAYAFDDYREGMRAITPESAPRIVCRRREGALEANVDVQLALARERMLELAMSAVLRDRHGGTSYWALVHPPGKPDFHHDGSYALQLALDGPAQ